MASGEGGFYQFIDDKGKYYLVHRDGSKLLYKLSDSSKGVQTLVATCPYCSAKPNRYRAFIDGAAKLFDFGGTYEENEISSKETDADALRSDWNLVGSDFYSALVIYDEQKRK
jgi:hypothetical protein